MHWWWSKVYCKCILPEQLNSCFCTSATLSPLSSGGAVHCVNKPIVGLCLSHWANHARWQSQFRLFEWRRLLNERGKKEKLIDWRSFPFLSKIPQAEDINSIKRVYSFLQLITSNPCGKTQMIRCTDDYKWHLLKKRNTKEVFSKPTPNTAFLQCCACPE